MVIPVERIAGGTVQNIMLYISIIGLLLFVATILRLKIGFLRKIFIPASLLAGFIGLALGPHALNVIPSDMMASIGALPGQLISVVFAGMMLGVKKVENSRELSRNVISGTGLMWSASLLQISLPSLLCVLFFIPVWNVHPLMGSAFEVSWLGGHGTAGGMIEVYRMMGWPEGGDIALTLATIGLMSGIFGGIIIINYGVRKKYTKYITDVSELNYAKETFSESERKPISFATVSSDVVEPFALHVGAIGISILIGRVGVVLFNQAVGIVMPLFPFAMVAGWILNSLVIQRISFLRDIIDRNTIQRIQGVALEILVVSAVAAISIPVVLAHAGPLLIGSIVMIAHAVFFFFWLSPRIFTDDWFEHGIARFGTLTAVVPVGLLLLRTTDPTMKSDAFTVFGLGMPFTVPFIGGGLLTVTVYPMLIQQFGVLLVGIATSAAALFILLLLRMFFWNKNVKMQQR